MLRSLKLCFLFLVILSCISCEEEEKLEPRKKTTPGSSSLRVFRGSFIADGSSALSCPNGFPASVTINFSQTTLALEIPETDMNGDPSSSLAAANQAKVAFGQPVINNNTGAFSAVFSITDSAEDFDANGCSGAGDTYAQEIRLSIEGAVVSGGIQNAMYEIINVCMSGSVEPIVCSGTFSGVEAAN